MQRNNTLKRFLMYFVVLIGALFIGFTSYYFARNDEIIALTINEGEIVYLNSGENYALPISHSNPYRGSEIKAENVDSSDPGVAYYSESTKSFVTLAGGVTTVTITPSNEDFGPFRFDILVGDGTPENPWYVSTARQLASIGQTPEGDDPAWTVYNSYELLNNINLSSLYTQTEFWTPIDEFYGTISGEGYTISNLKIVSAASNVGFVRVLRQNAKIENVSFTNTYVEASSANYVGTVAAINKGFIGKTEVSGRIVSKSQASYVGGVVGYNVYEGSRPILNMVGADLDFETNGFVGGIASINEGGIIFNSYSNIKSFNVYREEGEILMPSVVLGGVVYSNEAIATQDNEDDFRQAALKNVYSIMDIMAFEFEAADQAYVNARVALIAYSNQEGDSSHDYFTENVYQNVYTLSSGDLNMFINQAGANITQMDAVTYLELGDEEFYGESWNFEGAWIMNSVLSRPSINYSSSYEPTQVANPGLVLTSEQEVITAIKTIATNLSKEISFNIDPQGSDFVINAEDLLTEMGLQSWVPIGTTTNPYRGQFIVTGEGSVTIQGLRITQSLDVNFGFFGRVSGSNTIIQNITFKDVIVEVEDSIYFQNDTKTYAGVVAGRVNSAYIADITIDNSQVKNSTHAGMAVGKAYSGILDNINVATNWQEGDENLVYNISNSGIIYYGGIAGVISTSAAIQNSTVDYVTIQNDNTDVEFVAGGVVADMYASSVVYNTGNLGTLITTTSDKGYFGGIAGTLGSSSKIDLSYSMAEIISVITAAEDINLAGGIAAQVHNDSSIERSFSDSISIKAKYVGGIAALNYGDIRESYSLGYYEGYSVGGFTYSNFGSIKYAYTRASLKSIATDEKHGVAGFSLILPVSGKISYVYSSANLEASSGAQIFAETSAKFRKEGLIYETLYFDIIPALPLIDDINNYDPGRLTNYIVLNYGNAYVQGTGFNGDKEPKDFIITNEDGMKGLGVENPLELAGFTSVSPTFWTIEDNEWPTLTRVVTVDAE